MGVSLSFLIKRLDMSKPTRVTIAFDSDRINNFDVLPQGHIAGGYEFWFNRKPEVDIVGDKVVANFDYLITDGIRSMFCDSISDLLEPSNFVELRRSSKTVQFTRMLRYKNSQDKDCGMIIPKTFFSLNGLTRLHMVPGLKSCVIKPLNGARGIGQFKVNTEKMPIRLIIDKLNKLRLSNLSTTALLKDLEPWKEFFSYSTSGELEENEGLSQLCGEFIVQEHIDDIVEEYRIITDYNGDIGYTQKRKLKFDEKKYYQQAIGSTLEPSDLEKKVDSFELLPYKDQIVDFIKTVVGPLNSVDLFICKDGRWGIFEWCNQFGTLGVPTDTVRKLHEDFLINLVTPKSQLTYTIYR